MELEGVEPSSKQGNHTLSTCLFQPSVFVLRQDPDHQSQPYPLKFHHTAGARHDYFRFNCTAWPKSFGTTAFERCLVLLPCSWIKPIIYYTSIRQREHNCFRQINFWPMLLWSQQSSLRMLTYHFCPLSNPVNPRYCETAYRRFPLKNFAKRVLLSELAVFILINCVSLQTLSSISA